MKTYPLHSISLEQAKQLQFKVIDAVTRNFQGEEVLSLGDLGVVKGLNKPRCTVKVEKVFADTFDAPAALLVRGSGTGAIRWALTACLKPGDAILVHTSPIYTTTQVTIDAMGLKPIRADFNDLEQRLCAAQGRDPRCPGAADPAEAGGPLRLQGRDRSHQGCAAGHPGGDR